VTCPSCGISEGPPPKRKDWGARVVMCKACTLRIRIVMSARGEQPLQSYAETIRINQMRRNKA
jgi:hypothetical protein